MKIETNSKLSLPEVEGALQRMREAGTQPTEIWLARDVGAKFFVHSRLLSMMATANRNGPVTIVDWAPSFADDWHKTFPTSLPALAALSYATSIINAKKEQPPRSVEEIRAAIENRGGEVLDESEARAQAFCAFDGVERRQPLALASAHNKIHFQSLFVKRLQTAFNKDGVYPDLFRKDPELQLADLIYELWENGLQHGSLSRENKPLPGLRVLYVRRIIGETKKSLVNRAEGFQELKNYFESTLRDGTLRRLYEVAISDQGLGIVDRFLSTRPELKDSPSLGGTPSELVNTIIDRALSSKVNQPGSGHGIRKALETIRDLGGFVSLRTGALWLYSSPTVEAATEGVIPRLAPVAFDGELAPVAGTHYNILIQAP